MNVLVYSWFVPLASRQLGGTQHIVRDLMIGLSNAGAKLTVLCPEADRTDLLPENENLRLLPALKDPYMKQLFPYELQHNFQQIEAALPGIDVIWSIDQPFPLQTKHPVALRLDSLAYPKEVSSMMSLSWDALIVVSAYLRRIAEEIVGPQHWEGTPRSIQVIPNGIDAEHFSRTDPSALSTKLGLSCSHLHLLFPHRPDPNKGVLIALAAVDRLRRIDTRYRLLIPVNPGPESDVKYYDYLQQLIAQHRLGEFVILHEWLPLHELSAYYSLGECCLSLGVVPEGAGLTPIQAISCGTPVVSTRAGALRELFPPNHGVRFVDFNAVDQIVEAILNLPSAQDIERGRRFVRAHYSTERTVNSHLNCLATATKSSARYKSHREDSRPRLAPWSHLPGRGQCVWHDYQMHEYKLTDRERELIDTIAQQHVTEDLTPYRKELRRLRKCGIVIG